MTRVWLGLATMVTLAAGCGVTVHKAAVGTPSGAAVTTTTTAISVPESTTVTTAPCVLSGGSGTTVPVNEVCSSAGAPHFDTPQQGMTYLADAWNSGNVQQIDQ